MDVYDFDSFHFGAFENEEMYASCRIINSHVSSYSSSKDVQSIIKSLSTGKTERKRLQLLEFVTKDEQSQLDSFLLNLEKLGCEFNEASRLHKIKEHKDKLLMNYVMCYLCAFNRFFEIDYCYFDVTLKHCMFYERYFNCKRLFPEIKLYPLKDQEPRFMMQATIADLTPKMDLVVNRIFEKFKEAGGPCAVKLDEIR